MSFTNIKYLNFKRKDDGNFKISVLSWTGDNDDDDDDDDDDDV